MFPQQGFFKNETRRTAAEPTGYIGRVGSGLRQICHAITAHVGHFWGVWWFARTADALTFVNIENITRNYYNEAPVAELWRSKSFCDRLGWHKVPRQRSEKSAVDWVARSPT
jgi:hypothetical protein